MNERINELLISELTANGFSYTLETPIRDPEKKRYIIFSKNGISYLLSIHSGNQQKEYKPNLDAFKAALSFAENNNLNPLPIFDAEDGFFRPDISSSRETPGDRRWLSGLERITEEKFGEVTYASNSGLFVVSYGSVISNYNNAQPKAGIIPRHRLQTEMKTRKFVTFRVDFSPFVLDSIENHGIIKAPRLDYSKVESPICPRQRQILDLKLEFDELTYDELIQIQATQ